MPIWLTVVIAVVAFAIAALIFWFAGIAYRKNIAEGEGALYISTNEVELDTSFMSSKFVSAYFTGNSNLTWEVLSNDDVVEYVTSNQGINISVLKPGEASFKVSAGNQEEIINVNVYDSHFDSEDFTFNKDNVISGSWIMGDNVITGEKESGNAFLLSSEGGSDFTFAGKFSLVSGTAAALVFRASSDMSSYLVANYDSGEDIVKLWSANGEIARSEKVNVTNKNDITLTVQAIERDVNITINGHSAISCMLNDNEPLSGKFGLNVFSGKAEFKSLSIISENYVYASGEFSVPLEIDQFIIAVYNVTKGNTRLDPGYYYQSNGALKISEDYFKLLNEDGRYKFKVVGSAYSFIINVDVTVPQSTLVLEDMDVKVGCNVTVYVGNVDVTSVKVNGSELDESKYVVEDYKVVINEDVFEVGENEVTINDVTFTVRVNLNTTVVTNDDIHVDFNGFDFMLGIHREASRDS